MTFDQKATALLSAFVAGATYIIMYIALDHGDYEWALAVGLFCASNLCIALYNTTRKNGNE